MLYDLGKSLNDSLQKLLRTDVTDKLIDSTVRDIIRQLIANNVGTKCILQLKQNIDNKIKSSELLPGINKSKWAYNLIFDELVNLIDPKKDPYKVTKGKTQIIIFVGLQGAGKTTSICKYANFYKIKGFKTGIVCADTFRAGAFDQIKQNAVKINVPFFGSKNTDPVKVAMEGVQKFKQDKFELILIDTSGRHTQENDLFNEMKEIIQNVKPDNIVFVMDAGIGQSAEQQALGFKESVNLGSILLTKVDGAEKAGGAISSVAVTGCPIEFIGTGEKMTDLETFKPKRFINKLLGKGDLEGLTEKLGDANIDEQEMLDKFKKGTFTLKDFQQYLTTFISLGPISQLAGCIPGMPSLPNNTDSMFKQMIYIFDSMTPKELESDGEILINSTSRQERIAKGSGMDISIVSQLFAQFRSFASMMKKLDMNKMMNMFGGKNANPAKIQEQMEKMSRNNNMFRR